MKNKEKVYIGILVVIVIVVIIFAVTKNKEKENNVVPPVNNQTVLGEFEKELGNDVSLNTSDKLSTVKKFEGFEISEIQLSKNGNTSELLATVKNTTNQKTKLQILKVKLVDKNNNEIKTVTLGVKELEAGESTQVSTSASFNYVNAYDFIISK